MTVDRSLAQAQRVRDLLVGPAGRDQAQHVELASRQGFLDTRSTGGLGAWRRASSGRAPSRSKGSRRLVFERCPSSSPRARHALADEHTHARRLVWRFEALPQLNAQRSGSSAACAWPSASAIAPSACAATARKASVPNALASSAVHHGGVGRPDIADASMIRVRRQ